MRDPALSEDQIARLAKLIGDLPHPAGSIWQRRPYEIGAPPAKVAETYEPAQFVNRHSAFAKTLKRLHFASYDCLTCG